MRGINRTVVTAGLVLLLASGNAAGLEFLKKGKELLGGFGSGGSAATGELSLGEIAGGLREALRVGSGNVVNQLGATDGFNRDTAIRISLPESLKTVQSVLGRLGMSGMLDDLELRLNRAAEVATPKAKRLFGEAIAAMTIDDVKGIYNGPDDAATRYFQGKMSAPLAREMAPVVSDSLADVGAIKAYDNVMGRYRQIPFVPDVKANLTEHVVKRGMDGIFYYLAKEEAAIRRNPVKRTTEILQKVFGRK